MLLTVLSQAEHILAVMKAWDVMGHFCYISLRISWNNMLYSHGFPYDIANIDVFCYRYYWYYPPGTDAEKLFTNYN